MEHITLIGLMGSGKTYWGERLAIQLDMFFLDFDQYIEESEGMTIAEIFDEHGENYFREIEKKYLHLLAAELEGPSVISMGGGTPCYFDNMDTIKKLGRSFYLKTPLEILVERLKNNRGDRPLLNGKTDAEITRYLKQQLKQRKQYYYKADKIIDTDTISQKNLRKLFA